MSRKIKFHTFHILFRLFAFLADKSGGWRVFVRPKLLLGSVIVGLGLTACGTKTVNNKESNVLNTDSLKTENIKNDSDKNSDTNPILNSKTEKKSKIHKKMVVEKETYEEMVTCYEIIEQIAQFSGGEMELIKYFRNNLNYPESAIKNNIQGKVILSFVVTKTGAVDSVKVIRSLDPECDKEAIRVVKSLPRWIPCKENGVNVDIRFTCPVAFKLE